MQWQMNALFYGEWKFLVVIKCREFLWTTWLIKNVFLMLYIAEVIFGGWLNGWSELSRILRENSINFVG